MSRQSLFHYKQRKFLKYPVNYFVNLITESNESDSKE